MERGVVEKLIEDWNNDALSTKPLNDDDVECEDSPSELNCPGLIPTSGAGIGLTFSTIILPVAVTRDTGLAMALLILACVSFGIFTSNLFAITQTLAGPRAAGKWTGFQNGFGNLAGVVAPVASILASWSVDD